MGETILLVDDNANTRSVMYDILTDKDFNVVTAGSGEEALDKVKKIRPDVILLDTRLPGIDGNEVYRQIKKIEGLHAKVIIYTGYINAVLSAAADGYVVKTSDFMALFDAIKKQT